jgi:hypothetical protein
MKETNQIHVARHKMALRVSLWSIALLQLSACGSKELALNNRCTPGATQTCVTPSCTGAQICANDGTWDACSCGDGGGGAGNAGTQSGGSGTTGSGGAGRGGGGGAGTGGADSDSPPEAGDLDVIDASVGPGDAPSEGGNRSLDDPCPADTSAFYNCSSSCGGTGTSCTPPLCRGGTNILVVRAPAIVRTPEIPVPTPGCAEYCAEAGTPDPPLVGHINIWALNDTVKMIVPPPWEIQAGSTCHAVANAHCTIMVRGAASVITTQLDPPVRNITLEPVEAGATCP